MILNILPWIIAGLSLGGIIFIVARKIPVLLKLPAAASAGQPPAFFIKALAQKIWLRIRGLRYTSFQPALLAWLEKVLRKFRVWILRLDNVFIGLIGYLRKETQVWTVRSRVWVEQHRLKKIQKLQVLEKLDQAELLETIQKAKNEVAQNLNNGKIKEASAPQSSVSEEKICIDLIAQDPRNIDAYKRLGFYYCLQGNKGDAKNCFRQVLKLSPDDLEVVAKMRELAE